MLLLTRRKLVSGLSLAIAAGSALLPSVARPAFADPRDSEYRRWCEMLGQRFGLSRQGGKEPDTTLVLQEVAIRAWREDRRRPKHLRPAAISLLFSSSAALESSATYTLTNPRMESAHLFLHRTRCAHYPDSVIYEAVLN